MPKDLENLIYIVNDNFLNFTRLWENNSSYNKINLKKKSVRYITEGSKILETIYAYRSFLSEKTLGLDMVFGKNLTCNSRVFTRLKTVNSIKDKITKYNNLKEEKGGVPICNCLNDIFGVRIIQNEKINIEQVKEIFEKTNIKLKFVNSSKGLYKATHVYFKNTNFDFPWELQIWRKEDEDDNIISHAKYKRDYIDWVTERRKK